MPFNFLFATQARGVILCIAITLVLTSSLWAQQAVNNVRLWHSPSGTRIVFDVSSDVRHTVFTLDNPQRLVVDIQDADLALQLPGVEDNQFISSLRSGRPRKGVLRFVFDLKQAVKQTSFVLSPNELYGHRLVIDIESPMATNEQPSVAMQESSESEKDPKASTGAGVTIIQPTDPVAGSSATSDVNSADADPLAIENKNFVVAIDAGHGSEDPGATGHRGTAEKRITLSIAQKLHRIVSQDKGMTAKMIRTGDYFINLQQRRQMAREQGADVFVSIHADAFRLQSARGFSVFALSQSGATSAMAAALADQENASDLIGGVSLADKDEVLAKVLVDLSMNNTISESVNLGGRVLKELAKLGRLHSKRVEQAGFVVLKSADMPSILVETGFITNPAEESRLRTDAYQESIAQAIYTALFQYRQQTPYFANASYVAPSISSSSGSSRTGDSYSTQNHKVKRGDTLSELALQYGTSVSAIKRANGLKSDTAMLGQTLKIPTQERAQLSTPDVHVVTRGDSLSKISARYNITIDAIKRRNNLTKNTVYVGQKIHLGGSGSALPSTHKVKSGDTLSQIADAYGISLARIKLLNGLSNSTIRVGQSLKLQ